MMNQLAMKSLDNSRNSSYANTLTNSKLIYRHNKLYSKD